MHPFSVGRIVKLLFVLWLERVRRTTAGIHLDTFENWINI